MATSRRLPPGQVQVITHLLKVCGMGGRVTLSRAQRGHVAPLWRRDLVEIWHRISPFDDPRPHGPFFSLSLAGLHLAYAITAARREVPA